MPIDRYAIHDLGSRSRGEVIEITLSGNAANVRLMDASNLQRYKAGRDHRYIGGLVKRSPVRLTIPRSGHWYVTVDLQGMRGRVRSSVAILPGALPAMREIPLASVPSLVRSNQELPTTTEGSEERTYDVFISYASEDKDSVVRPLAEGLRDHGLSVWYDEFELRIGDSLRRKIDSGIAHSRFGVVILSSTFISKGWTNYELDGLVARFVTGEQVLLPIWHNITKQQVMAYSPSLADRVARNTTSNTVDEIAAEIAEVIHGL